MPSFLTLAGVPVQVFRDTVEETTDDVGEVFARGLVGNVVRTRTGRLRSWRFATPPVTRLQAERLRRLIEGDGQRWGIVNSVYSDLGVGPSMAGTFAMNLTGGPTADQPTRMTVPSGGAFAVRMQNRLGVQRRNGWVPGIDGYTLLAWRNFVGGAEGLTGWLPVCIKGGIDFARGDSGGNPLGVKQYYLAFGSVLSTTTNLGNALSVSTSAPYVALHGRTTAGVAAAIDFGSFAFLPYEVDDAWVAPLLRELFARGLPMLPKQRASGEFFDNVPVEVVCRVRTLTQITGDVDGGGVTSTNRALEVEMMETL